MKIAVTYENGQIFQHFGHSESFKIYETEGKNIVRAEVIGTDGAGHSALAAILKDKGVDVLICGGIGNGAVTALSEAGDNILLHRNHIKSTASESPVLACLTIDSQ